MVSLEWRNLDFRAEVEELSTEWRSLDFRAEVLCVRLQRF